MSVRGKTKYDWEFRTFSDFGVPGRRRIIGRHYSERAALRAFKELKKSYSRFSDEGSRLLWRCWQEDRRGVIVRDTGAVLWPENNSYYNSVA
jgi:hypothetical protein